MGEGAGRGCPPPAAGGPGAEPPEIFFRNVPKKPYILMQILIVNKQDEYKAIHTRISTVFINFYINFKSVSLFEVHNLGNALDCVFEFHF